MRVLWIDDEGQDKFVLETDCLESEGWTVEWARGVPEAAEKLRSEDGEPFRIVLLDQIVVEADEGTLERYLIWSACRLLYWLRQTPSGVPRPWLHPNEAEEWSRIPPASRYREIPALLVSAYHDNAVLEATRKASERDRGIKLMAKPADPEELLRTIKRLTEDMAGDE